MEVLENGRTAAQRWPSRLLAGLLLPLCSHLREPISVTQTEQCQGTSFHPPVETKHRKNHFQPDTLVKPFQRDKLEWYGRSKPHQNQITGYSTLHRAIDKTSLPLKYFGYSVVRVSQNLNLPQSINCDRQLRAYF